LTSSGSGGIYTGFEVLAEGAGAEGEGAEDEDGRTGLGVLEGDLEEEDVIGAEGAGELPFCEEGPAGGGSVEPAADTVFFDPFFDFFDFAKTGEERCNCRIATLGSTPALDLTSENTTGSVIFREGIHTNSGRRHGYHDWCRYLCCCCSRKLI
jgi:hypothetical protein